VTQPQFDRYVDAERIASGSQATVYRALDPGLGRTVAIKVMHPHLVERQGFVLGRGGGRSVLNGVGYLVNKRIWMCKLHKHS
jgi:serine/threonine protein kinase